MTKATKTVRKATKTAKKMMNPSAKKRKKGFTLIELLIVVGILAVVAAVAIPNLTRFMGEGKEEAWESDQNTLATAVLAYRQQNDEAWPLCEGTTLGAPVFDSVGGGDLRHVDVLATDANGIIDLELLEAGVSDSYLSSRMDSACSFNYDSQLAAGTNPTITGDYGHWVWYINTSGQIEGFYFDADIVNNEAPEGPCDDYTDSTNRTYP